jgi:hypothetical protein
VTALWQCSMSGSGAENSEISTTTKIITLVILALQGLLWMQHEYRMWFGATKPMKWWGGELHNNDVKMAVCECRETNLCSNGIFILIPSWEKFFYDLGVMLNNNDTLKEKISYSWNCYAFSFNLSDLRNLTH